MSDLCLHHLTPNLSHSHLLRHPPPHRVLQRCPFQHREVAGGREGCKEGLRVEGQERGWEAGQPYPTRRYPGTVLVLPLSRTSNTAVSAAPRGISLMHMRFFLDTEASGSWGQGGERGKRVRVGYPKMDLGGCSSGRCLSSHLGSVGGAYITSSIVTGGDCTKPLEPLEQADLWRQEGAPMERPSWSSKSQGPLVVSFGVSKVLFLSQIQPSEARRAFTFLETTNVICWSVSDLYIKAANCTKEKGWLGWLKPPGCGP
jgi:hypothetical protein